jgi:hypothetical protein
LRGKSFCETAGSVALARGAPAFLLGPARRPGLVTGVFLVVQTSSWLDSFGDYPRWLVVAGLTLVAAAAIWILAKAIKWTLWLLLIAVLLVGGATALWLLFQ